MTDSPAHFEAHFEALFAAPLECLEEEEPSIDFFWYNEYQRNLSSHLMFGRNFVLFGKK